MTLNNIDHNKRNKPEKVIIPSSPTYESPSPCSSPDNQSSSETLDRNSIALFSQLPKNPVTKYKRIPSSSLLGKVSTCCHVLPFEYSKTESKQMINNSNKQTGMMTHPTSSENNEKLITVHNSQIPTLSNLNGQLVLPKYIKSKNQSFKTHDEENQDDSHLLPHEITIKTSLDDNYLTNIKNYHYCNSSIQYNYLLNNFNCENNINKLSNDNKKKNTKNKNLGNGNKNNNDSSGGGGDDNDNDDDVNDDDNTFTLTHSISMDNLQHCNPLSYSTNDSYYHQPHHHLNHMQSNHIHPNTDTSQNSNHYVHTVNPYHFNHYNNNPHVEFKLLTFLEL
jgi:hypothetical protein